MKCLIIDPSKSSRLWLAQMVRDAGLVAEEAASGIEGLRKFDQTQIDLILLALFLDDMDGVNFVSLLRTKAASIQVPVVMITLRDNRPILERAVQVGITEVYAKDQPIRIKEFLQKFVLRRDSIRHIHGHVLYVEDSRPVAYTTSLLLKQQGLTVDHVTTAEAALEAFDRHDYDLVLADLVLEGKMSGLELLRTVRAYQGKKANTPVLIMTSFTDEGLRIELFMSGASDYIAKPALDAELIARVKNQILAKQQQDINAAQHARLQTLMVHDQLTGLYSRHFLFEVANARLNEAVRYKTPVSLMLVNIDQLKSINDTYGQSCGNAALKLVADILKRFSHPEHDVIARTAGGEFSALLSRCELQEAMSKADHIRNSIATESLESVTVSICVGQYQINSIHNFGDLFQVAELTLRNTREQGRNKVVHIDNIEPIASGEHTTQEAIPAVPLQFSDIDIVVGLEKFQQREDLYRAALDHFETDSSVLLVEIDVAMSKLCLHAAKDKTLLLAGLAQRLGMKKLHELARNFVSSLHRNLDEQASELLKEILSLVQKHVSEIKQQLHGFVVSTENGQLPLHGLKILVVDDCMVNRMVLEDWLNQLGAEFSLAEDGLEAWDKLNKNRDVHWDIVLSDIEMPGLNGYELAARLWQSELSIPVIAITSLPLTQDQCRERGFIGHVVKPLNKESLQRTILSYTTPS